MVHKTNPPKYCLSKSLQLYGDVDIESITRLQAGFIELYKENDNEWITLLINSSGGSVSDGFAFCDFIKMMHPLLITVALGNVSSIALPMFLMGQYRLMGSFTDIEVHNLGVFDDADNKKDTDDVGRLHRNLEKLQDNYIKIILEKSRLPMTEKMLRNLMKERALISSKQAFKFGWVHKIIK